MPTLLIKNAWIVNEHHVQEGDVYVRDGIIFRIGRHLQMIADRNIDGRGKYLLPGVIDDQVHFREPGLTHKADLETESRAAVAGGITSYMEMPNTVPQTLTQELLEAKYQRAAQVSRANYSFFMGASNDNLDEVLKTDPKKVCGVKVFMGSSTGNMLVDDPDALEGIFRNVPMLVAVHCESEQVINRNLAFYRNQYKDAIPVNFHPNIRSADACYQSSSQAVALARRFGTRLHVLHISTARELALFHNDRPLWDKQITAEACVHHLWFSKRDYASRGMLIKWNPAIKTEADREALIEALLDDRLDIIATDHAPHTLEEKDQVYTKAPSGAPMVQHALPAMLELAVRGLIPLEKVVEKMCHAPAVCFRIDNRGFIREGYYADLVLVDPDKPWTVSRENVLYKCGWSPLEGTTFRTRVSHTLINGQVVYEEGRFNESARGMRLRFERD